MEKMLDEIRDVWKNTEKILSSTQVARNDNKSRFDDVLRELNEHGVARDRNHALAAGAAGASERNIIEALGVESPMAKALILRIDVFERRMSEFMKSVVLTAIQRIPGTVNEQSRDEVHAYLTLKELGGGRTRESQNEFSN